MSPLPYSADSQTAATCHYRQPFRLYASDIYFDANITFLSQTRNKTDAFLVFSIHLSIRHQQAAHMAPPWHAGAGGHGRRQSQPSSACRQRPTEARAYGKACRKGLQNGPCSTAKRHISQGGTARFATAGRPATQPAAGQAVCRSRPVGAKTARHPGCGSKAPKAETTHSRPQYKAKGAAPHDATPSKNPNLFISYLNITVIACFKMRRAASRIATRRQPRQHDAPYGMRPAMDAATHAKINITLQLLRV